MLGSLFLLILINDQHLLMDKCKILMYADDTVIFYGDKSAKAVEDVVNREVDFWDIVH